MDTIGTMLLGLGLFFVGMRFVGDNFRHLSSRSFRRLVAQTTGQGWVGGLLGLVFGALMQSATAVTFILVSMVGSGLITGRHALPIIAWTNVGLTLLSFVASLNVHPLVAYLVGVAGIALAFFKKSGRQAVAGVLLGIGLLLLGLQTIQQGAGPLRDFAWFQELLAYPARAPLIGFVVGVGLALVIQSNTAAVLVVVALANARALDLTQATMIVYGANLGTIFLRLVLAAGLHGSAVQLVRFEDFFCLLAGALMGLLFYLETLARIPLVAAFARALSSDVAVQLAIVFLLSNLLPALLLAPLLGPIHTGLNRLWPAGAEEKVATLKYLKPQALDDPETALDLLYRELARLLAHMGEHLTGLAAAPGNATATADQESLHRSLGALSAQINDYVADLAGRMLRARTAARLVLAQKQHSLMSFLEQAVHEFAGVMMRMPHSAAPGGVPRQLVQLLEEIWKLAARAAMTLEAGDIEALRKASAAHGDRIEAIRAQTLKIAEGDVVRMEMLDMVSNFELIVWMLHRLAKLLADACPHPIGAGKAGG